MKFYSEVLALCVFHPIAWGGTAFVVQAPKAFKPSVALRSSTSGDNISPGGTGGTSSLEPIPGPRGGGVSIADIWDSTPAVRVEGESLKTWMVDDMYDRMHVSMTTDGRPLHSKIELWHGPDYTPSYLKIYNEDGYERPFNAVLATPLSGNTVAIYNKGAAEFPLDACVQGEIGKASILAAPEVLADMGTPQTVQGGRVVSYPFPPAVESVQVLLNTDGRNLKARIELMQGPNNDKQVIEYYASDGMKRPFFCVIETPGAGNVVRLINQHSVEFPMVAYVEPYLVGA